MRITQLFALGLLFLSTTAAGWESYDFDVSYVRSITNGSCQIGMTNLGVKSSDDATICDAPVLIHIANCSTDTAKQMVSMAMTAEMSGSRMRHQATAEATYPYGCAVKPYSLTLYPKVTGADELVAPVFDEEPTAK